MTDIRKDSVFWLVVVMTAIAAVVWFMPPVTLFVSVAEYSPWHLLVEFVSITIAILVFAVGWYGHTGDHPSGLMVLSCGSLFVALTDIVHVLSYPGMPDFITANRLEKPILLWLVARGMEVLLLLWVAVAPWRSFTRANAHLFVLSGFLALFAFVCWIAFAHLDWVPATYIPGLGLTPFKIRVEYAIVAANLIAAALLLYRAPQRGRNFVLLAYAAWITGVGEVFFTAYIQFTDLTNLFGHFYKAIAYIFIFHALFISNIKEPYEKLVVSQQQIQAHQRELLKLSLAIEQNSASVIITNIQGAIEYANPKCLEVSGYVRNEVIGKNPRIFQSGEHSPEFYRSLWRTIAAGQVWTGQLRNRRKNGELYWERTSISPVTDAAGVITHFVAVKEDITEIKAAREREAELKERLVQANKMEAIGHLTGGIAHDFNNILAAILGYAELGRMMMSSGQADSAKVGRYLDEIVTASKRARDLIAQMLAFSRRYPDAQDATQPVVLLQPVVKEVFSLMRSSLPASIRLSYRIENPDTKVGIKPVHLHQILMNLCINSRDAIGSTDGVIACSIATRTVAAICSSCGRELEGNYVEIAIVDDGSGIPEPILNKIFDPFFTTKEIGKGTGMGLSVVHGLVHEAQGHVCVESRAPKGTTIRVLLPAPGTTVRDAGDENGAADTEDTSLSGVRLVIVDDERAIGSMLFELMEMKGAQVEYFDNGIQALEYANAHGSEIDLVITDEAMPGMSGTTMAARMLERWPGLPIVLCSGSTHNAMAGAASAIGIKAFMQKPLDFVGLIETIRQLVPDEKRRKID